MRLWKRKPSREHEVEERASAPPSPALPKSGDDLRQAFLKKLEARDEDSET